ncbi:PREDICTED: uncharacterized protein LOC108380477 [Rhagoletis zephyria]|uniref:uncharacterized protein LOC108380477 n=1 Tax=Rhagoletis zephyria TaxID=28612 RepID=UPI00081177ED|nr:PREDICTED: uncharacterized protein LOC108380477 [Rhagoletis zephyria]
MFTKQVISALFFCQVIAAAFAQTQLVANGAVDGWNVTTKTDDYVSENRRQYNATLKSYLDQINNVKNSLENELKVLEKQKVLLLSAIQETHEKIDPLEVLSLPSKYCVQKYRGDIPYADMIKANIESCITNARSYSSSIVSTPSSYYNTLYNYYNNDLKSALTACGKLYSNPSFNYTICVTNAISKANTYTINNRKNFATAMQSSDCGLNSRIDIAVSCTYTYFSSTWSLIGAATRLIDECIKDYLEDKPQCVSNNTTVVSSCPNVIYMEVKDGDFQNRTIANPLQGLAKEQNCLELRFV